MDWTSPECYLFSHFWQDSLCRSHSIMLEGCSQERHFLPEETSVVKEKLNSRQIHLSLACSLLICLWSRRRTDTCREWFICSLFFSSPPPTTTKGLEMSPLKMLKVRRRLIVLLLLHGVSTQRETESIVLILILLEPSPPAMLMEHLRWS